MDVQFPVSVIAITIMVCVYWGIYEDVQFVVNNIVL